MTAPDSVYGMLTNFCNYTFDSLVENKEALGLADVFYDDQNQIPRTPTACVVPDEKSRELAGVPRLSQNTFGLYVLLYTSKIGDVQDNARDALAFAEQVEFFLHSDPTLGGLVVHSFCTRTEPGYRTRDKTTFRACRIKFEGINKSVLGM
jgi:hypothetical protein